ncbi:hypothetical protein AVEN_165420-1 [Araneus ventricosus]|uniref:RNase H type-1 domain-containing protein n=1 Tax=Araneus ventricosus TaxID=182803 RepID=A0A4Y2AVC6_ARAVE|nr:hypothetical protein AVEN_165420-1 [Araneus ventricosus]
MNSNHETRPTSSQTGPNSKNKLASSTASSKMTISPTNDSAFFSTPSFKQNFYPLKKHAFGLAETTTTHPSIQLGWIKAHVGHKDNEATDSLAKQATSAGSSLQYPASRNLLKSIIKNSSLRHWQEEWDNGLTGRNIHRMLPKVSLTPALWNKQDIIFATGHGLFPNYCKRFHIKESDCYGCGEMGDPLNYATSCPFNAFYHLTKPTQDLGTTWWNKFMKNKLSRIKQGTLCCFSWTTNPFYQQIQTQNNFSTSIQV